MQLRVASVCTVPNAVAETASLLAGSEVAASTTIGFPHGMFGSSTKQFEAREALRAGARELDMVVAIGRLLDGDFAYVREDIAAVLAPTRDAGAQLKVIFETAYLSREQKLALCDLCTELAVDWVKTSTGFAPSGATLEDVRLMRERCPPSIGVKASGGIRELGFAEQLLAAGAGRLGTSASAALIDAARSPVRS